MGKPQSYSSCRRCRGGRYDPDELHAMCKRCNGSGSDPENITVEIDALIGQARVEYEAFRAGKVLRMPRRAVQVTPSNDIPATPIQTSPDLGVHRAAWVTLGLVLGAIVAWVAGMAR